MKKVSLIIPVYNTKDYLEKCLRSACDQTYSNMEIICVDDGSTDGSEKIVDEFAGQDNRIKVIHEKNRGESAARNAGLKIATGDYIGFLDCDDWIEKDMYENLVEAIESENVDIAAAGWYKETEEMSIPIRNEKEVETGAFGRGKLLTYVYERDSYRGFAYMWDKLYKRSLFYEKTGTMIMFDEDLKIGGDVLFLANLVLNAKNAVYVDRHFYHYLQRRDSGCHFKDAEKRMDWLEAYMRVIRLFELNRVCPHILDLVKRFLVYHSGNAAEIAYEQKNRQVLQFCQEIMERYKEEYCKLNLHKPERIQWFKQILEYEIRTEEGGGNR